ncbi:hypothetical protein [Fluviicola sp.]|uniref:hypothetical protein n=1 Tax=Fluviicola sp. TaxID=1917219 RepID=UPI0031D13FA6
MNNSIYYLLGHIDNYAGGFSYEEGIFKRISLLGADWKINPEKVHKSERLLKKSAAILEENNLPNDIRIEKWEQDKGLTIFSKNLVELMDISIPRKSSWFGRDDFQMDQSLFDAFEWRNTESNSHKQRLNFLAGVMDSNAVDNQLYFYNDYDKCVLTHSILKCFADDGDQLILESNFGIPWVDIIKIKKEGPLWKSILKRPSSK